MRYPYLIVVLFSSVSLNAQIELEHRYFNFVKHSLVNRDLPGTRIKEVCDDRLGRLWMLMEVDGLVRFDGKSFVDISRLDSGAPFRFERARELARDAAGNIWTLTDDGNLYQTLIELDSVRKVFAHGQQITSSDLVCGPQSMIWMICDQLVYAISTNGSIVRRDTLPERPTRLHATDTDIWAGGQRAIWQFGLSDQPERFQLPSNHQQVNDLTSIGNQIWAATNQGLLTFNSTSKAWNEQSKPTIPRLVVKDIIPFDESELWMATDDGIYSHQIAEGHTRPLEQPRSNVRSTTRQTSFIYRDQSKAVWTNHPKAIYRLDNSRLQLPRFFMNESIERVKMSRDSQQLYLLHARGASLTLLDRHDATMTTFAADLAFDDHFIDAAVFADQLLLFGTSGVYCFSLVDYKFELLARPDDPMDQFSKMIAISDSAFLLLTHHLQFYHFDAGYGHLNSVTCPGAAPKDVLKRNEDLVLVYPHRLVSAQVHGALLKPQQTLIVQSDPILAACVDQSDALWTVDQKGVVKAFDATSRQKYFDSGDLNLHSYKVEKMITDRTGCLWISHGQGIARFNPVDTTTLEFGDAYWIGPINSIESVAQDLMYLASSRGFYMINPARVQRDHVSISAHISGISINGETQPGYVIDNSAYELTHDQNRLAFAITAVNMFDGVQNQYRYRLIGYDDDWQESPVDKEIRYTNLSPGDYLFEVSCRSHNLSWSAPTRVCVAIARPWWSLSWFRITSILLILLLVYKLVSWRIKWLAKKQAQKFALERKIADLKLSALKAQMNPHFLFNCLNSIESLIISKDRREAVLHLSKFSKLIRRILQHSRQQYIPLAEELETLYLYLDLECLRLEPPPEISVDVDRQIDCESLLVPPMLIQPLIENAIWHGLRLKKGLRTLALTIRKDSEYLSIVISDNGIGRREAARYKSKTNATSVGLSLVRDRLDTHIDAQGATSTLRIVDLYDALGQSTGTEVHLSLPVRRSESNQAAVGVSSAVN